ncbi:protein-disulfide reductase DsbD family protein [Oceanispirochaeta crateris]|nr:thioredoxin family protein [Oceanispirochaeta crateris]
MIKKFNILLFLLFSMTVSLFSQISFPGLSNLPEPELHISFDKETYRPGEKAILKVDFIFPDQYHQTYDTNNFRLEGLGSDQILFGSTLYSEGELDESGFIQYYDSTQLQLEMMISESAPQGPLTGMIKAHYQLCDEEGICYFPESLELEYMVNVEGKPMTADSGSSLWIFLLMALMGGFLLNLMPCVLPLLSVKAMNLISQSGEKRPVLIKHGLLYTAGILLSFWVLTLVIVLLQHSGRLLGWGFHFQSPLFLSILTGVIFLFALSLFEVFILLPPSSGMNKADNLSRKKGYTGSFFTGIFAVFVATPCTAPFLGSAMGFAFSQPGIIIFLIMTLTGLGLSLPFLLLGFFPGFFKLLPKPGKWMDKFREAMGFLLLGTVVYLSSTLIKQVGTSFASFLWYLLILALAAWIWGWSSRQSRKRVWRNTFRIIPIVLILVSGFYLLDFQRDDSVSHLRTQDSDWEAFDPELINQLRNEGTPLFIAFSAEWCTSCKVNERTVLSTEKTRLLFEQKGVRRMKADLTVSNPLAMEWIFRYERAGVPLYLLFLPGQDGKILPELLSANIMEEAFSSLPDVP